MKILLFYFAELGYVGGVEMVVRNLARAFAERGHSPAILQFSENRRVKPLAEFPFPVWSIVPPSYPRLVRPRSLASFARAIWQYAAVARKFRPDIVHVHYPLSQSIAITGAARLPHRWRAVVTVHGSEIRTAPTSDPNIVPWQTRLFGVADALTAVSRSLLADTLKIHPGFEEKASVIPNSVDSRWFLAPTASGDPASNYFLFVGRLHHVKAADLLLQAWADFSRSFPGMRLLIVGDGPERGKLIELADRLTIRTSVSFLGNEQPDELKTLYRKAFAFVLSSRSEGMPLTLLEAGASGALCIGTPIPGIQEIVKDGETGLIANSLSAEGLVCAMKRAVNLSNEERIAIRAKLREKVANEFSEATVTDAYLRLFDSLRIRRAG
jgi:glycosyltransferase involved in cell wall biosynthesis